MTLEHECPPRQEFRYVAIPDALHDLVASPREYQLVALLLSYRWTADSLIYPSVRTLAARLRCSERTVQRTCSALEARGLLVREARYRDDSGQTSNVYHLAGALLTLVVASVDARRQPDRHPPGDTVGRQKPATSNTIRQKPAGNRQISRHNPTVSGRIPTSGSAYLETRRGQIQRR